MAVNYASKYSQLVDERFTEQAVTTQAVNSDYDWNGVQSVIVYDVDTAPMNDYTTSGTNRYGSPGELGTGTQVLTVGMDRSFTFTIDRKNYNDQQMAVEAGSALRRQLDEVVIPETDQYIIAKMLFSAGNMDATAITKSNAYEKFLDARALIRKNRAPMKGLIAYVSTKFYKNIKLDDHFIKASDIAQEMLLNGQVGKVDNIPLIEVPDDYLCGAEFIITHPVATTFTKKIEDYKIHDNPPGINGWLVEGRVNYDAFVRRNKKGAIFAQIAGFTTKSEAGEATKTILSSSDINLELAKKAGFTIKVYSAAASGFTAKAFGDDCSALNTYVLGSEVVITATHKVQLILCDADGKAVVPGSAVVAVLGAAAGGGTGE
jgi:hypothetical protein